jgi:hypothetical protein
LCGKEDERERVKGRKGKKKIIIINKAYSVNSEYSE